MAESSAAYTCLYDFDLILGGGHAKGFRITGDALTAVLAKIASYEVKNRVEEYGGIAIPAHIDRESNSMLFTLGAITEEFDIVELSTKADEDFIKEYEKSYRIIIDSDAHTLDGISVRSEMELTERSIDGLWKYLKGDKT